MKHKLFIYLLSIFMVNIPTQIYAIKSLADLGCRPSVDNALDQYIIGYGSLMQEKSKKEDNSTVRTFCQ